MTQLCKKKVFSPLFFVNSKRSVCMLQNIFVSVIDDCLFESNQISCMIYRILYPNIITFVQTMIINTQMFIFYSFLRVKMTLL